MYRMVYIAAALMAQSGNSKKGFELGLLCCRLGS